MSKHGPTLPLMTREASARRKPLRPTVGQQVNQSRQDRADRNNIARVMAGLVVRHHRLRGWELCSCGGRRQAKNCHGRDAV